MGCIAKFVLWKLEEKWSASAGQHDNEMMWADNYWLFCDSREKLICMVNDFIEELFDLVWSPSRNHCGGQAHTNRRM